ncbi:uncharacterized protein LOC111700293 [Eurytemora carolleeae]|uniref:uncharacterized protein LOC111700293 n=1 Tax=Eurytemora carolleeae TaxID=1294199 RepID=UPI000C77B268|nr:uncharacterized protein LOC111700293 [Eurytemora carolleeae]|eukprot:XP_023326933.1 uncharacterized protein LOC111700293 [Eurytemora affinis]
MSTMYPELNYHSVSCTPGKPCSHAIPVQPQDEQRLFSVIEDKFYDVRQGEGSLDQVDDVFNARDGLNAPGWFDALIKTNTPEEKNYREGSSDDFEHRNRFATTDTVEVESYNRFQHQADSRRTNAPTDVRPFNRFQHGSGFVSLSDSRRTNSPVEVESFNRFQHQADSRGTNAPTTVESSNGFQHRSGFVSLSDLRGIKTPTTVESSNGFQHRSGLINLDWEDEGVYSSNRFDGPYLYDENRVDLEDRYGYSKDEEEEMPEFSSILQANTGKQTGVITQNTEEINDFKSNRFPAKAPERTPDRTPQRTPDRAPERAPEKAPAMAPESMSQRENANRRNGYFERNKNMDRYDPFSFHDTATKPPLHNIFRSTERSYTVQQFQPLSVIDSRHSVQEHLPKYKPVKSTKSPIIVNFNEIRGKHDFEIGTDLRVKNRDRTFGEERNKERHSFFNADTQEMKFTTWQEEPITESYYGNKKQEISHGAGYKGAINPIFVSLDQAENREILSQVPTQPPRLYFPVKHANKVFVGSESKPSSTNQYKQYQTTTPSREQHEYWDSQTTLSTKPTQRPWKQYGQIVEELLNDEQRRNKDFYSGRNKFVGDPQYISTRPLVVGPSIPGNSNVPDPNFGGSSGQKNTGGGFVRFGGDPNSHPAKRVNKDDFLDDIQNNRISLQPPPDMLTSYSDRFSFFHRFSSYLIDFF